jgi:hypothetical protein
MDGSWLHRYRLSGDEDCGVGIECRDHFDGGRPLAYYDSSSSKSPYAEDPAVQYVSTIAGLLSAAEVHEHEKHGQPPASVVEVRAAKAPDVEEGLRKLIQNDLMRHSLRDR